MGMRACTLRVHDYRSYPSYELALDPGLTVLVGPNAAGKTNLVEALQLLTAGQSFRRPAPVELVRAGATSAELELSLAGDGRRMELGCVVEDGRRSFVRNGKRTTAAGVRGVLPSVLFCPDHLDMIKRSASVRRAALDDFGVQLNSRYAHLASTYARTVEQRNSLLRDQPGDSGLLEAWTESLVAGASALTAHRLALLARLRQRFETVYRTIAPGECAAISYEFSCGGDDAAGAAETPTREQLAERMRVALAERHEEELRRGCTLVGPHRDELRFTIDGRDARAFGSQGQQRSLVLAWKIAEVQVTCDILGYAPLLLLDDVMSELDAARREAILRFIEGSIQTVITTTNLGYFSSAVLEDAKVVAIDGSHALVPSA